MCNCGQSNKHTYACDAVPARLDEMFYKDIMGEIMPNSVAGEKLTKLPYRDWAPLVPFVKYVGTRHNTMKYFVPNKYNGWDTYVRFVEWDEQLLDTSVNVNEAARLLLWGGNIQLHCNCPAYQFWGFAYIQTQLGISIRQEDRFPTIRNPQLKGIACKHLIRTLKVLPFHLGDIAHALKSQRAQMPNKAPVGFPPRPVPREI